MPRSRTRKPSASPGHHRAESPSPAPADPPWLQTHVDAVHLTLRVQPRSSRNAVEDELGGRLRVRLTAPPVDSKANDSLVAFLAEQLDCPRHRITLLRGHASRLKTVEVRGLPASEIQKRLTPGLNRSGQRG